MPKVSRNSLSEKVQKELGAALNRVFVSMNDRIVLDHFLDDLLTATEKIMLGKRLMAAVLLQRGYSYRSVCRALKLSAATVNSVQRELQRAGQGYRYVFEKFFRKEKAAHNNIMQEIDHLLDMMKLPIKGSPKSMKRWLRAMHS